MRWRSAIRMLPVGLCRTWQCSCTAIVRNLGLNRLRRAQVICLDNFFTGSKDNVKQLIGRPNFELMRCALERWLQNHTLANPCKRRLLHVACEITAARSSGRRYQEGRTHDETQDGQLQLRPAVTAEDRSAGMTWWSAWCWRWTRSTTSLAQPRRCITSALRGSMFLRCTDRHFVVCKDMNPECVTMDNIGVTTEGTGVTPM